MNPEGCPKGQRNAAQHECLAAVLSTMMARDPEVAAAVTMQQLKLVNDGANSSVPLGCSYSRHSKAALFNSNKAAGSGSDQYQLVCVEDEIAPVTVGVRLCEAMGLGNAHGKAHRRVALSAGPEREGYVHNESARWRCTARSRTHVNPRVSPVFAAAPDDGEQLLTYDPPVSAIKGHRYHPIPDTARRRHGHHRIRDRKISGYRPIGNDLTRKSARGQSKTRLCWRVRPARPALPSVHP